MSSKSNTKFTFLLIFTISFVTLNTFGSPSSGKCEIYGVVKDSLNGEHLPFATIQILTSKDSSFVKGSMTNSDGYYHIKNIDTGKYIITASYMGYNMQKKTLDIQSKKIKCDFFLIQKNISLSEVSINTEKNLVERSIEKVTINVSKDLTLSGGSATDVIHTIPSVDIDINGNINYKGSNRVLILINGEKSELTKSLDQIPAEQIDRIELINNPSAKYEAEGMSGIINIVLKSNDADKNKTTLMISTGYPETAVGNVGYSAMTGKTRFFTNAGMKHNTKFQTKEHLRENYENPNAYNYYQYDRQDANLNDAFINSNLEFVMNKKQKLGISFIGSKKFNNADRQIDYKTLTDTEQKVYETLKKVDIELNNYTIDGNVNYHHAFKKERFLTSKIHYSLLDQLVEMNNKFYPDKMNENYELQNTFSQQTNKKANFKFDYVHPFNDSTTFESGYSFNVKDLLNDFSSESYNANSGKMDKDTALSNIFNYIQQIHAVFIDLNAKLNYFEIQAGLRSEYTINTQNSNTVNKYLDFFPSVYINKKFNNISFFVGYNLRVNRPTIKMLNPFSDEYADLLNMHKGNPDLKPEYVNSIEIGNRFVSNKFTYLMSVYYRNINQAISRIKSASNDSALVVTFINLEKAKLTGGEFSLTHKPVKWWNINFNCNIFHTNLAGDYENNIINNNKIGWNLGLTNSFKVLEKLRLQLSGYYKSKLPSVLGTYKERYYTDFALSKKVLKNKAQVIFKISDVFNTYTFGLDLNAIDENNYKYKQKNRRKNESRYFVLSFIYNIDRKEQSKKKPKENFFLDDFEK